MFEKLCALKNKKGFTLIEMLVVIAIIAVLVAVAVPVVSNSTTKAKAATDAANLRTAMSDANVYILTEGSFDDAAHDFTAAEVPLVGETSKWKGDSYTLKVSIDADGVITAVFSNGSDSVTLDDCMEAAGGTTPESGS